MNRKNWVWMPHPAHFICGRDCRFHLATWVGEYIVSTVGEYLPDSRIREIFAKSRGVNLEGIGDAREADYMKKIGFEEIGYGRKFETFVFPSRKRDGDCGCDYGPSDWSEVDSIGTNCAKDATENHYAMCEKWSRKKLAKDAERGKA